MRALCAAIADTISGAKDAAVAGIKKAVGLEGDAADGQAMLDKLLGEHAEVTKGEALDTIEKGAEEVRASGSRAEKFDAHEQVGK